MVSGCLKKDKQVQGYSYFLKDIREISFHFALAYILHSLKLRLNQNTKCICFLVLKYMRYVCYKIYQLQSLKLERTAS